MRKILILLSVLFICSAAFAQSADVITEILESPRFTYGQACYLSASSQNLISDDASYDDAILALESKNQINDAVFADQEIKLVDLAYIYTKMFNLKGGLMYRITKGSPRYSLKLLKSDGIIPANTDP